MRPGEPPLQLRLQAFKSDSCSFHLKLCSWLLDVARAGPWVAWEVKGPRGTEDAVPAPGRTSLQIWKLVHMPEIQSSHGV